MNRSRLARRLAPGALAFLLAVVLLAPATLGGKVASAGDLPLFAPPFPLQPPGAEPQNPQQFDSAFVFEPDGLQVREALRSGALPVWTDAQSAGRPLLAAQQSAPLYPLTWIAVAFPYWESLEWILVLKLTLAALGTILLARALGLGLGPSLLAGVAFGFGSYMVDWLMHPHTNAYLVLPWMFLAVERLCRTGAKRDAALLGLAVGLAFLGGHPQSALLVSAAAAAWLVYRLAAERPAARQALRVGALAMAAGGLGLALAAVMLVPFAEALREAYATSRGAPPLEVHTAVSLFFPEYWGRPDRADTQLGPSNFTERTFYVGVLPVLLAAAVLFARRPRGPLLFFAGLLAAALAVALDTRFLADAVIGLPGLESVNLNRLLVVASFALAMMAGFGAERFLRGGELERRRMVLAAAVAAVLPVLAVLLNNPGMLKELPTGAERMLGLATPETGNVLAMASVLRWLGVAAVALLTMLALSLWERRAQTLALGALALVVLDLVVMGFGFNPAITKAQAEPPEPAPLRVMRDLTAGGARVVGVGGLEANTASRWGLQDARGHEQPVVERHQRLWYALGGGTDGATLAVAGANPGTPRLLDVFGVRAVLLNPFAVRGDELVFAPSLQRSRIVYARTDGVVLQRRSGLPVAFVAYRWRGSPGLDSSLGQVAFSSSRQMRDEPVIETGAPSPANRRPATPARVVARSDTEVTLDVRADAPGRLVLLDTHYPGWEAEVDGRSVPIEPANAAFRSVAVEPGRHEVRFSYRPASVLAGAIISVVALLLLALAFLLPRSRGGTAP